MAIFQKNVLDSHILEQIILGDTAGTTVDCDFSELELINSLFIQSVETISNDNFTWWTLKTWIQISMLIFCSFVNVGEFSSFYSPAFKRNQQ